MKVLHLGPLWFPISREAAGGRETSLAGLLSELEIRGCRNTLLAAGDSHTAAELLPVIPRNLVALMAEGLAGEMLYYREHQRTLALAHAAEFDVIHSHLSPGVFSLSAVPGVGLRVLHTHHTPVWQDLE